MKVRVVATAVATGLLLTACGAHTEGQAPSASPRSNVSHTAPAIGADSTSSSGASVAVHGGDAPTSHAPARWTPESRSRVIEAAEEAMRVFARPSLSYDAWWADLEPLLTAPAAQAYAHTLPANIPASKVTGSGRITDASSPYVAAVRVPTDAGDYTVVLNRAQADAAWQVVRITPGQDVE